MRRRFSIHALLKNYVNRPLDEVQPSVLLVLELGVYQIIFMTQIPAHASVHEAVEMVRRFQPRATGFVNGVMRRIAELVTDEYEATPSVRAIPFEDGRYRVLSQAILPDPESKPIGYLHEGFSWPLWIARKWHERFGWSECIRLGFWYNAPGAIWLRVNRRWGARDQYCNLLDVQNISYEKGTHLQSIQLTQSVSIRDLPEYEDGAITVQDISSMRIAEVLDPKPGMRIMDLCAAPGGKTTHIAELMDNRGEVIACDIERLRLRKIEELASRLRIDIIQLHHRQNESLPSGPFDAVLADVPCSNTGVLGRRPEVRNRLKPNEFQHLTQLQARLLSEAIERVKIGGTVVYSTCTIEPMENEELVTRVIQNRPEIHLLGEHTTHPGPDGDGGYWAKLQRHG